MVKQISPCLYKKYVLSWQYSDYFFCVCFTWIIYQIQERIDEVIVSFYLGPATCCKSLSSSLESVCKSWIIWISSVGSFIQICIMSLRRGSFWVTAKERLEGISFYLLLSEESNIEPFWTMFIGRFKTTVSLVHSTLFFILTKDLHTAHVFTQIYRYSSHLRCEKYFG